MKYNDKIIYNEIVIIEHIDKDIYFRDVHLFIDRVKQFVFIREDLIYENL